MHKNYYNTIYYITYLLRSTMLRHKILFLLYFSFNFVWFVVNLSWFHFVRDWWIVFFFILFYNEFFLLYFSHCRLYVNMPLYLILWMYYCAIKTKRFKIHHIVLSFDFEIEISVIKMYYVCQRNKNKQLSKNKPAVYS